MKKRKNQSSTNWAVCIGIVFLVLLLLYFYFRDVFTRDEKKEALREKILSKEQQIEELVKHLNELKELRQMLELKAIQLYKSLKLTVVVILVAVGFVGFSLFSLSIWGTIASVIALFGAIYKGVCIVAQNKVGDFNLLLVTLEQYFIERTFRKNAFEPALIQAVENKINIHEQELIALKCEFENMSSQTLIR